MLPFWQDLAKLSGNISKKDKIQKSENIFNICIFEALFLYKYVVAEDTQKNLLPHPTNRAISICQITLFLFEN